MLLGSNSAALQERSELAFHAMTGRFGAMPRTSEYLVLGASTATAQNPALSIRCKKAPAGESRHPVPPWYTQD